MAKRIVLRVKPSGTIWKLTGPLRVTTQWADVKSKAFGTQAGAIHMGRAIGRSYWFGFQQPAQLVVHGRSGRILWETTYGLDPRRTKG